MPMTEPRYKLKVSKTVFGDESYIVDTWRDFGNTVCTCQNSDVASLVLNALNADYHKHIRERDQFRLFT